MDDILSKLGPLAQLVGRWEGSKGEDIAPDDNLGVEKNLYRETLEFTPFGPVNNHAQCMYGLKYSLTAWRVSEDNPFHEEMGYWLWDEKRQEVYKCFLVPRGVSILAGGKATSKDKTIKLSSKCGSMTYGICSNPFLHEEFKTSEYTVSYSFPDAKTLVYDQDTVLVIPSQNEVFHHRDKNTLKKM